MKEFQPENNSLFKITFSYPAKWNWQETLPGDDLEPFVEYPPSERIVSDSVPISIQVFAPTYPQETMQEWADAFLSAVGPMLRNDINFQIDGNIARWLTVEYPSISTGEPYFSESIYLLTNDRLYTIDLSHEESEEGRRLLKEFTSLINTIKVLP